MHLAVVTRRVHKWLALAVGLQALLWTLTGLYMTAVHIDLIHGDHLIRAPEPRPFELAALADPAPLLERTAEPSALRLTRLLDRPVYVVEGSGPPARFDARSGERLAPPSEATIRAIAARAIPAPSASPASSGSTRCRRRSAVGRRRSGASSSTIGTSRRSTCRRTPASC